MKNKLIFARIAGGGFHQIIKAKSHEIMGLPAGTYHKFELENGTVVYINDFGIRTVTVADSLENLD
jgi:hypothetical protein